LSVVRTPLRLRGHNAVLYTLKRKCLDIWNVRTNCRQMSETRDKDQDKWHKNLKLSLFLHKNCWVPNYHFSLLDALLQQPNQSKLQLLYLAKDHESTAAVLHGVHACLSGNSRLDLEHKIGTLAMKLKKWSCFIANRIVLTHETWELHVVPTSFFCPDHFSFSRRISSRQPQQPWRTQPFSGLLQLNTSWFRPTYQITIFL
jgi:hypothetical protein